MTKREILRIILKNPEGVSESDIRDFLRDNFNIREARGIKKHLSELRGRGYISKTESPGKPNKWFINFEISILINILDDYPDLLIEIGEFIAHKFNNVEQLEKRPLGLTTDEVETLIKRLKSSKEVIGRILSSEAWKAIIHQLLQKFRFEFKKEFGLLLSLHYMSRLIYILTASPTAFLEFLRYCKTPIRTDYFILRDLLNISELNDAWLSNATRFFEGISDKGRIFKKSPLQSERLAVPSQLVAELNFRLYYALVRDLEEGFLTESFLEGIRDRIHEFYGKNKRIKIKVYKSK